MRQTGSLISLGMSTVTSLGSPKRTPRMARGSKNRGFTLKFRLEMAKK